MSEPSKSPWRHALALGGLGLSLLGGTGCEGRQPQSASCQKFVACVNALDEARGSRTNLARFEPEGACWGSPEGAKLCGDACERGVGVMRERMPELPGACAP
ncbi:MAG TPA: hypothetical protein VFZ09_36590 [Archangium sp.]|uniref:hypothetical protein n=1 Tax=Archangium sp. TaxID=1872627 RepID=UPI002E2ED732|nr:hypothetical protein [Archangium sp.]HEX5751796.1 hypothetical protein [Archangium sp.]